MSWKEPVFDRTKADVDFAIAQIKEWKKATGSISFKNLKGCFNVKDMNRIESDLDYLNNLLEDYYYGKVDFEPKHWDSEGIPDITDIKRLTNGLKERLKSFEGITNPKVPEQLLDYKEVNDYEELLFKLKRAIETMEKCFKKCGTFKSGQNIFLPIERT